MKFDRDRLEDHVCPECGKVCDVIADLDCDECECIVEISTKGQVIIEGNFFRITVTPHQ